MKDIKKILSEQSRDILPDDKVKQNIKHQLGFDRQVSYSAAYAHGGEDTSSGKKMRMWTIVAIAAVIVIMLCVFLPIFFKKNGLPGGLTDKFADITDADSFYAYGAASVGSLIDSNGAAPSQQASVNTVRLMSFVSDTESQNAQIDTVNRYMSLVEGLLGDGNIKETAISGNDTYQYGMSVSYADLLGSNVTYTLYYNKIYIGGESHRGESEENYSIEGVLVIDGNSYPVEGRYEIETEEDEQEGELYFKAYTDKAANSYIQVKQEYENETEDGKAETEKKYVYTVYGDGALKEQTSVDYESEDGELELRLTISKNGKTETLMFTSESENGESVINVRGNVNGNNVRFRIYVRQGQYHYVFEDGSSSDHNRNPEHGGGHFDDDDDD